MIAPGRRFLNHHQEQMTYARTAENLAGEGDRSHTTQHFGICLTQRKEHNEPEGLRRQEIRGLGLRNGRGDSERVYGESGGRLFVGYYGEYWRRRLFRSDGERCGSYLDLLRLGRCGVGNNESKLISSCCMI